MKPVITDSQLIEEALTRSVDTIYPSRELLSQALSSGERLTFYCGWDATGTAVHLGHVMNYSIIKRFHALGHRIILLVGDFTAMIGDPSDKSSARIRLTKEQVNINTFQFKEQISKIFNFEDKENPIEIRFNSEWLSKLTFDDVIELASNFTVQHMIERDTFKKRLKEEKPLYVHEFMYPLMQGYDSVAMNVDVEIGGTDQLFNMLAGRTLLRKSNNKEKFVITHPMLEDPETGKILMSKSEGTGIFLTDSAEEMYRKAMLLPDSVIVQMFIHSTEISRGECVSIEKRLEEGENPRDIKMELAREIVRMYHGTEKVNQAELSFQNAFQKDGMPSDAPVVSMDKSQDLAELFIQNGIISSKSEWRRLVDGNAVTNLDTQEIVSDYSPIFETDVNLRLGKKKFVKITVKN